MCSEITLQSFSCYDAVKDCCRTSHFIFTTVKQMAWMENGELQGSLCFDAGSHLSPSWHRVWITPPIAACCTIDSPVSNRVSFIHFLQFPSSVISGLSVFKWVWQKCSAHNSVQQWWQGILSSFWVPGRDLQTVFMSHSITSLLGR